MKSKLFILFAVSALLSSCHHWDDGSYRISGSYSSGSFANNYYMGNPMYYESSGFYYNGTYWNQPYYYVPGSGFCVAYVHNSYRKVRVPNFRPRPHYEPPHNRYANHSRPGNSSHYVNHYNNGKRPPVTHNPGKRPDNHYRPNSGGQNKYNNGSHDGRRPGGSQSHNRPDNKPTYVNNRPSPGARPSGIGSRPGVSSMNDRFSRPSSPQAGRPPSRSGDSSGRSGSGRPGRR